MNSSFGGLGVHGTQMLSEDKQRSGTKLLVNVLVWGFGRAIEEYLNMLAGMRWPLLLSHNRASVLQSLLSAMRL